MRFIAKAAIIGCLLTSGQFAHAQTPAPTTTTTDTSQYGWLEGTITNTQGQAISEQRYSAADKHITGVRQGGGKFDTTSNYDLGGFYSVKNMKPGIYDITVEKGYIGQTSYCPQRILGVLVKPNQRTILSVVMNEGETYEEIGKPAVATFPATNVVEELAQMQKQIDDLKAQLAALQQKLGTATAAPPTAPATPPATPTKQ